MAVTLLILLGGIIGVGFIGNLFFEKTRIPSVLLLIAIGIFPGRLLGSCCRESPDPVPWA